MEDIEHDESVGFELISTDDIDDIGIPAIIAQIRERVGTSPVYLRYCTQFQHLVQDFNGTRIFSLDIDVIGTSFLRVSGMLLTLARSGSCACE